MRLLSAAASVRPPWLASLWTTVRRFPPAAQVAIAILAVYVAVALTGPLWAPYDYARSAIAPPFQGASFKHLLGTDILGRDVFSRVIYGARIVLLLSLTSTAVAVVIGGMIGLISGLLGGWVDQILMRTFEALISIPLLVLALLVITAAGPQMSGSRALLIGIVVFVFVPRIARIARTMAVDLATRDFVTIARARGESVWSITWRELAPNAAGVLLVEFGVRAGFAPILISSLGFLGFGEQPPSPDWGLMISENRSALFVAPLTVLGPALALSVLIISLNLLTDGVARALGRAVERRP